MEPKSIKKTLLCLAIIAGTGLDANAQEFRDCEQCPVMIELPAGSFLMGTAVADRLTDPRTGKPATNDSPQHEVNVESSFAIGKYEVTVDQFAVFAQETGYQTVDRCMEFSKQDSFTISEDIYWNQPGFDQTGDEPAVCMSFFDAQAYVDWLSNKTGENYRLPSEAEWEYAARAGSTGPYFWGSDPAKVCEYANVRSPGAYAISKRQAESDRVDGFPCDDGITQSAAAGSFSPNAFGLYDMQGNSWEWVIDCNHKDYEGAPTDGSPWLDEDDCRFGVIRGGSYLNLVERSSTTVRAGRPQSGAATNMGFRVVKGSSAAARVAVSESSTARFGDTSSEDTSSHGARLFSNNCAACHLERDVFTGLYGKDQESVETAIRRGGNNVMSMPAFGDVLSEQDIATLAAYLRELNGWD